MISLIVFAVLAQSYATEIISEYVIRGNNGLLKCNIPGFMIDFVYVISWIDSTNQVYETGVKGMEL